MGINKLYEAGEDALSNLWTATFSLFPKDTEIEKENLQKTIEFRIESLRIPEIVTPTYMINYGPLSFERVGGKIENPKEMGFSLRVDKEWVAYEMLTKWKFMASNDIDGSFVVDDKNKNYRINLEVAPFTQKVKVTINKKVEEKYPFKWVFENIFPKNIPEVNLDYNVSEPIKIDVTLGFLKMEPKGLTR